MTEYNEMLLQRIIDKWQKIGFMAYDIPMDAQEELLEGNKEAYEDLINLSNQMKEFEKLLEGLSEKYLNS